MGGVVAAIEVNRVMARFVKADAFAGSGRVRNDDAACWIFVKAFNSALASVRSFFLSCWNVSIKGDWIKVRQHLLHVENRAGKDRPDNALAPVARKLAGEGSDIPHFLGRAFLNDLIDNA